MRRARREAAWHAQCGRLSVFSAVAQTLLTLLGYSAEGSPAASRCSSSPGRIRAPRPARTRPARPARPLRTFPPSLSVDPLSFLLFVRLSAKGAPAHCKVLSRPGERHPRDGGEKSKSALQRSASLPGGQTPRASPEYSRRGLSRRGPPEVRVGGAGPARPCEGGGGAVGCLGDAGHRVPAAAAAAAAAPAAAALAAAAAARASRAGYINTRFHTPELTSAGPAQPRAGGGRER